MKIHVESPNSQFIVEEDLTIEQFEKFLSGVAWGHIRWKKFVMRHNGNAIYLLNETLRKCLFTIMKEVEPIDENGN